MIWLLVHMGLAVNLAIYRQNHSGVLVPAERPVTAKTTDAEKRPSQ